MSKALLTYLLLTKELCSQNEQTLGWVKKARGEPKLCRIVWIVLEQDYFWFVFAIKFGNYVF